MQITKACRRCKQTKPLNDFNRNSRASDGHRSECRSCSKELYQEWLSNNRDHKLAYNRRWNHENKEYFDRYYEEHAEERAEYLRNYRRKNRDRRKAYNDQWFADHPGYRRDAAHKRRARLAHLPHEDFTSEEIFERDSWICQLCRDSVDPTLQAPDPLSKSLDHIIPISYAGVNPGHVRTNVQLAHLRCNISKNNKHPEDFPTEELRGNMDQIDSNINKEEVR